ncbi:MAG: A/G-specific adenine glycosylase [Kiloniellaceae bacterium]
MTRPATPFEADGAGAVAPALLDWYDRHGRALPWRVSRPARADPYAVWLSEIMLQQTTVGAVIPYFEAFRAHWPRVDDLAAASLDDVLAAWAGLGYDARARNLHACARVVGAELGGRFPETEAALRRLPGIGPYTAAAIAAIAFGRRACVVDGNVERVIARVFAVESPLPGAKATLHDLAASLLPPPPGAGFRYGDLAQATMDLGATVCLPRRPRCDLCPLAARCRARAAGRAEALPRRAPKAARPTRRGVAFWLVRGDGAVWLTRRPPRGLLGGMIEVPSTAWRTPTLAREEAMAAAPATARWTRVPGKVRHTFTHFHLELAVWTGRHDPGNGPPAGRDGRWLDPAELESAGLPTVMRKVARHALATRRDTALDPL